MSIPVTAPRVPLEATQEGYLYFCYGSNLDREKFANRVDKNDTPIEYDRTWIGRLKDWRLCFDLLGAPPVEPVMAGIRPKSGHEVYGLVYRLKSKECWKKLLKSEGVTENEEWDSYWVVEVEVECFSGSVEEGKGVMKRVRTLVTNPRYRVEEEVEHWVRPSRRYLGLVVGGAEKEGLPEGYVDKVRESGGARGWDRGRAIMVMGIPVMFMSRRWWGGGVVARMVLTFYVDWVKGGWGGWMLMILYLVLLVPTAVMCVFSPKVRGVVARIRVLFKEAGKLEEDFMHVGRIKQDKA